MTEVVLLALVGVAICTVAVVVRERLRIVRALRIRTAVRAASPPPQPIARLDVPRPLLEHPEHAYGWVLATPDGACAAMSDGARRLLGAGGTDPVNPLAALLCEGESEVQSILSELNQRSLLVSRRVHALAAPAQAIELAGVALRDRSGELWGSALLIRPAPQ